MTHPSLSISLCVFFSSISGWQCKSEPAGKPALQVPARAEAKELRQPRSADESPDVRSAAASDGCTLEVRPLKHSQSGRLVAIGDVHGDLAATRRALRLAGAIDETDAWIGGSLIIVQTGDVLDRGDDEQEILDLFTSLKSDAKEAGGAFYQLNGNHELMNAMGDFRYVTMGGFADFVEGDLPETLTAEPRAKAFFPGGQYAQFLADNELVVVVGDSIFVHGGVLPRFVGELEQANRDSRCYLMGQLESPPAAVLDPEGPLWSRDFSAGDIRCDLLKETLAALDVKRMVVGHTPQLQGITSACDGMVWRIDTGMASFYQGPTEVLEISDGVASVLKD